MPTFTAVYDLNVGKILVTLLLRYSNINGGEGKHHPYAESRTGLWVILTNEKCSPLISFFFSSKMTELCTYVSTCIFSIVKHFLIQVRQKHCQHTSLSCIMKIWSVRTPGRGSGNFKLNVITEYRKR